MSENKRTIRCAVYTRKSSEEGLEQSFNSLDAQREASQSYILSQRHEGWRTLPTHYDDGGYSGGSMERPALQQLLLDIKARKVDTVVVYKLDRLTRSLMDFAKIIEIFDAHGVSFVSVTQHFNTTTSMGRLTLNILLSFAQFEREVTGERIRDKIAASKRKGMWMGGMVPLGYDLKDHHLLVNREEAKCVRQIFKRYLDLGCVERLQADLARRGIKTKVRPGRSGRQYGDAPYGRGGLYQLLQNKIYIGEVPHKDQSYPGVHEAIVPRELWDAVQSKLKENAIARRDGRNAAEVSILKGLLFDEEGARYTPSHTVKHGKRYRYYTSQRVIKDAQDTTGIPGRLPASDIEGLVIRKLKGSLTSDRLCTKLEVADDDPPTKRRLLDAASRLATQLGKASGADLYRAITATVDKIVVHHGSVELRISKQRLRSHLLGADLSANNDAGTDDELRISISANLEQCRGEKRILTPGTESELQTSRPNLSLFKAVSRANDWARRLLSGEYRDLQDIARRNGLDPSYVSRIFPAAFLAPEVIRAVLDGRQHPSTTLDDLLELASLPWPEQKNRLGIEFRRA